MTEIPVLFEDDRVIAVDKPAGRLVIPGRGEGLGEPVNLELERRLGAKVLVVHRLDREASGVLLFAKDPEMHRMLCGLFAGRRVGKRYQAAVLGEVARAGTIARPLKEFGSGRIGVGTPGKRAVTRYRPLRVLRGATLLELEPETGRRHQLRVHCYAIGHPILGDPLYGSPLPVGGVPRLLLHASTLSIPLSSNPLELRSSLPEDFVDILSAL